jgi:hypothetical protein
VQPLVRGGAIWPPGSKQARQFLRAYAGVSKNNPQCAAIQLAVIGRSDGRRRVGAEQNQMAPLLAIQLEADLSQGAHKLSSGDNRQLTHTHTTWVSKSSSGTD